MYDDKGAARHAHRVATMTRLDGRWVKWSTAYLAKATKAEEDGRHSLAEHFLHLAELHEEVESV